MADASEFSKSDLIVARWQDFFGHRTPWHRRLWNVGTVLTLRETIEYTDACTVGAVQRTEGLQFVVETARREVARDPGVEPLAAELELCLAKLDVSSAKTIPRGARDDLWHLSQRAENEYLDNWGATSSSTPVEFTSRAVASHLLDLNFSPDHLYRWITAVEADLSTERELIEATHEMVGRMFLREYEVFVPCAAPYEKPGRSTNNVSWVSGEEAAGWLRENIPSKEDRRQSGGLLIKAAARDPWAAIDDARSVVARADSRARVARPSNDTIRLEGWARIASDDRDYTVRPRPRRIEIGSLHRQGAVYQFDDGLPTETDDALELAASMESPSAGAAIAGGWAATEALFIRPGEGKHHTAADRLAALVACSLPRAEMTPLAYRHLESASGDLATRLSGSVTNQEKVLLVENHLTSGRLLTLESPSDFAAQARMLSILADPASELKRIHRYMTESCRRLYNQRNAVLHSGSLRSVALSATTRTALSLVGAGLDRVVHAQLENDGTFPPLSLVARAETELRLVGSPGGRGLAVLLD